MNDLKVYMAFDVDKANKVYNKLTNNCVCPFCQSNALSFLTADNNNLAVTQQTAHFIDQNDEPATAFIPVYTLVCTNCAIQQFVNANILLSQLDGRD